MLGYLWLDLLPQTLEGILQGHLRNYICCRQQRCRPYRWERRWPQHNPFRWEHEKCSHPDLCQQNGSAKPLKLHAHPTAAAALAEVNSATLISSSPLLKCIKPREDLISEPEMPKSSTFFAFSLWSEYTYPLSYSILPISSKKVRYVFSFLHSL